MSKYNVGDPVRFEVSLEGEIISIKDGYYVLEYEDGSRHILLEDAVSALIVHDNDKGVEGALSAEDIEKVKI